MSQQIELARFETLGIGRETNILPAVTHRIRGAGVDFPASSDALTPLSPAVTDLKVPRFSVFHFDSVKLHGLRLLEAEGRYFHDLSLVSDEVMRFPPRPERRTPEDVTLSDGRVASHSGRERSDVTRGVVLCTSAEASNYGSVLFRLLPKLLLGKAVAAGRPIFVSAQSGWIRHIIQLAVPEAKIIPHQSRLSHRLEDVLVPSLAAPAAYLRPEIQEVFAEFSDSLPRLSGTPERIYLSRRDQAKSKPHMRVLENEDELVARLSELGITEYVPERYSFEEQVCTISQAKLIICPGGSGLFNTYFAQRAELIVDLEASREWLYAHRNVLASSGCPFTLALGKQIEDAPAPYGIPHRNWTIDIDAFLNGLKLLGVA